MIYNPPAFKVEDLEVLYSHIDRTGLATLVTVSDNGPLISHLPLFLVRNSGTLGKLVGHLARGNPQLRESRLEQEAVVIFQGPDAYISPSWYPTKQEHGKVVPTWNYAVVHVHGAMQLFEDKAGLRAAVDHITQIQENRFSKPWTATDAPPDYIDAQLKGIVGIEITIRAIEGKYKLSQNRSVADQLGVIDGLGRETSHQEKTTASLMKKQLPR